MLSSQIQLEKPLQDYLARWRNTNWKVSGDNTVKNILRILRIWFKCEPKRILDIGCMNGYVMDSFIRFGYDAWGLEPADFWKLAENKDRIFKIPLHELKGEKFDFIFCSEVMEHIPIEYIAPSLKAVREALTGIAFFTISEDKDADPTHVTIMSRDEWIEHFENAGLKVYKDKINFMTGFNFYCVT